MSAGGVEDYGWERTWLPSGYPMIAGTQGFFSASLEEFNASGRHGAAPSSLRDLRSTDVLLLRGPSGSGKTFAMRQERDALVAEGRSTEWVDLTTRPGLSCAEIRDVAMTRHDLTLFIDGADFALLTRPSILEELSELCDGLNRAGFGIATRMTIRSGIRCERVLSRLGHASEREIAPLSVDEVIVAASHHGVEPEGFLRYVEALRAGPLATQPPTLRMLLALFRGGGEKPRRRDVLYRDGCLALAEEEEPARLDAGGGDDTKFVGTLDAEARVAVARRIAASMVFGDKEVLDLGAGIGEDGALRLQDVVNGAEPIRRSRLEVSRQGVREVVRTGLFRSDGGDRYAFAHPSLMEFLAASFVNERGLDPAVVLSLVRAPSAGGPDRIAGNRIDVASWLAAIDPERFATFSGMDPQVLLRSGIPARLPEDRMRLGEALLQASATDSLDLEELRQSGDLLLVSNPGLAPRLREVFRDRSLPRSQRSFAVMLATDCGVDEVASDLLHVAADPSEEFDLRVSSLLALRQVSVEGLAAEILRLARGGFEGDRDEELRGLALDLAYPRFADAGEVIRSLVPHRSGAFGNSYDRFCLRLARGIRDEELLGAMSAIMDIARVRRRPRAKLGNFVLIASGIAKRAFSRLDKSDVGDALAELVLAIPDDLDWASWSDTFHIRGMPKAATWRLRRKLVGAIVGKAPGARTAKVLLEFPFLVRDGDMGWLCRQAASAQDEGARATLSTLALEVARAMPGEELRPKLRQHGLHDQAIDDLARAALPLAARLDRWRPPRNPPQDDAPLIESLERSLSRSGRGSFLDAILDARLLNLRRAAPGRAKAAPVAPATLLALAEDAERRLVQDGRDLLAIVVESLDRLQVRLTGQTPLVRSLWDETVDGAKPKGETILSDFVVDHLRTDLADRMIFADREVEVRPRIAGTAGQRTDVRVQATATDPSRAGRNRVVALTIEVKGCWNPTVRSDMRTQLSERYMATTGDTTGLYVVGWYVCDSWKTPLVADRVDRRDDAFDRLAEHLRHQAEQMSDSHRIVAFRMLDVALR